MEGVTKFGWVGEFDGYGGGRNGPVMISLWTQKTNPEGLRKGPRQPELSSLSPEVDKRRT